MQLSIKTHNLTVSVDIPEDEDNVATPNSLMLAAYEAIEHIYTHDAVVRAYYETDPYYTCERNPDDPVLTLMPGDVKLGIKRHR